MPKIERKYILLIALVAVMAWISDAAMDSFVLGRESFVDAMSFREPDHENYIELFFILFYSIFGVLLVRMLTKQRKARGELQKHLTAIETSMDGIALFNKDHEYLYTNDSYAQITGFRSPSELLGKSFNVIYNASQISWLEENVFPALERTGKWHGELIATRKDRTAFIQEDSIKTNV